ncbi:hypothetical protein B296_00036332 [Ensete ventricosum]|uniref:Uncharacterized protein n=1 Tax=Ensete ventricosum TaxID=4639 RepID=A0A426X6Y4_ENSVE|nr:hypothetical protein B296_00036332 [Ensete ventricosum]
MSVCGSSYPCQEQGRVLLHYCLVCGKLNSPLLLCTTIKPSGWAQWSIMKKEMVVKHGESMSFALPATALSRDAPRSGTDAPSSAMVVGSSSSRVYRLRAECVGAGTAIKGFAAATGMVDQDEEADRIPDNRSKKMEKSSCCKCGCKWNSNGLGGSRLGRSLHAEPMWEMGPIWCGPKPAFEMTLLRRSCPF